MMAVIQLILLFQLGYIRNLINVQFGREYICRYHFALVGMIECHPVPILASDGYQNIIQRL